MSINRVMEIEGKLHDLYSRLDRLGQNVEALTGEQDREIRQLRAHLIDAEKRVFEALDRIAKLEKITEKMESQSKKD